jgi:hypothetical protein
MSRVEELKAQIKALSPTELRDQQFEHDALTCRFGALANQALNDLSQGRTTDL